MFDMMLRVEGMHRKGRDMVRGYVGTENRCERWRVGSVFRVCFDGRLLQTLERVSIRPGETGIEAAKREGIETKNAHILERSL